MAILDIHPFERAGLGVAPFRFIGMSEKVYCACPGAPAQPAGTCDYCGNGIRYCYHIKSADGREFVVGCDCVQKTDRACLVNATEFDRAVAAQERKLRQARRAKTVAKEEERIAAALAQYPAVRERMGEHPHPNATPGGWFAGKTLADWADYMAERAGHSGRLRLARVIEKFAV
ncbi:MAG: hypothetical protein ABFC88_13065 [Thermoguttaceae bacterium]